MYVYFTIALLIFVALLYLAQISLDGGQNPVSLDKHIFVCLLAASVWPLVIIIFYILYTNEK